MNKEKLKKILENHKLWLEKDVEGERANLCGANFRGADLRGANLCDANLRDANLRDADLCGANLYGANLSGAYLRDADLCNANLRGADLCGANLYGANLSGANLRGAYLRGADLCNANLRGALTNNTTMYNLQCPETGSFEAWKKCRNNILVKLLIPEDSKRSSATSRKCRAEKAVVLDIIGADEAISKHDKNFTYRKGDTVEVDNFDTDRWNECSAGIHFFITRQEAELY